MRTNRNRVSQAALFVVWCALVVGLAGCGGGGGGDGSSQPTAGAHDTTFASTGIAVTPVGTSGPFGTGGAAFALTIQSDGKVVVVGFANEAQQNEPQHILLARYSSDGKLDPAFGNGGIVTTTLNAVSAHGDGVVLQSAGRIVVAAGTSAGECLLLRYTSNGLLDATFGYGGLAPVGAYRCGGLAIRADAKIAVAVDDTIRMGAVLFNSDGSVDSSFGVGGAALVFVSGGSSFTKSVAVQSDGKILVGGLIFNLLLSSPPPSPVLIRFDSAGMRDSTFPNAVPMSGGISSIALQPDGKIIAASNDGVWRFLSDGSLDSGFGATGKAIVGGTSPLLALQPSGKIVVASRTTTGQPPNDVGRSQAQLSRLTPSGIVDATFGDAGLASTVIEATNVPYAVAIQPDAKIVLTGYASVDKNALTGDVFVARYIGLP